MHLVDPDTGGKGEGVERMERQRDASVLALGIFAAFAIITTLERSCRICCQARRLRQKFAKQGLR